MLPRSANDDDVSDDGAVGDEEEFDAHAGDPASGSSRCLAAATVWAAFAVVAARRWTTRCTATGTGCRIICAADFERSDATVRAC